VSRARAISGPGSEFLAAVVESRDIRHRESQRRDQARKRKEAELARKKLQPDFTDQGICLLKVV